MTDPQPEQREAMTSERLAKLRQWCEDPASQDEYGYDCARELLTAVEGLTAERDALRNFVAFVNLWCHRESKVSDTERLSMIKFHPTAQAALGRHQQRPQSEDK